MLLYALADLDAGMRFTETWIVLGSSHLAVACRAESDHARWSLRTFRRDDVQVLHESAGLSGSSLAFLDAPDGPALAGRSMRSAGRHTAGAAGCVRASGGRMRKTLSQLEAPGAVPRESPAIMIRPSANPRWAGNAIAINSPFPWSSPGST